MVWCGGWTVEGDWTQAMCHGVWLGLDGPWSHLLLKRSCNSYWLWEDKYSVWSSFQVRVWTVWIMCSRQSVMTLLVSYQARVELLVGLGCFYPVAGTVGSWRGVIRRANLLAPLYPHQWMVGLQWWSNWRWGYHCPQRPSWWVRSCFFSYISPCISKYWNNFVLGGWVLNDQKIAFWLSRFLFLVRPD